MSRRALITGGGGTIAAEIATRLDRRGYDIVLVDVDADRMAATAGRLTRPATTLQMDLTHAGDLDALCSAIAGEYADLALLVNNAGYIEPGHVIDLDPAHLTRHVEVNLIAPMRLAQAAARVMAERRRGDILSLVSMGGIIAMKSSAAYAASKFGLRGFHTSLRSELVGTGVRVMGVFPSGVDTPMLHHEALNGGSALNFVGEVLTPAQVADACLGALDSGRLETYIPFSDSVTTRFFAAFPGLIDKVLPRFEAKGEKGRQRFIAERGLGGPSIHP